MAFLDCLKKKNVEGEVVGRHPLIAMGLGRGTRDAYFRGVVLAAFLDDGKVDDSERAYLRRVGLGLDLPDSEVDEMISSVGELKTDDDKYALLKEIAGFVNKSIVVVKLFLSEFTLVWRAHSSNIGDLEAYRVEIAKMMGVDIPNTFWQEFDFIFNDKEPAIRASRRLDGFDSGMMDYLFPKKTENRRDEGGNGDAAVKTDVAPAGMFVGLTGVLRNVKPVAAVTKLKGKACGAIGIDFGTDNCQMAVLLDGKPTIVPNSEGEGATPSVVAFTKMGKVLIGTSAKNQLASNPDMTFHSFLRFVGRRFESLTKAEIDSVAYRLVPSANGCVGVSVHGQILAMEEIAALLLRKMKCDAEAALDLPINKAVLAFPAWFNLNNEKGLQIACQLAGLTVSGVADAPSTAAVAYGFGSRRNENVAVCVSRSEGCDVSIVAVGDGVYEVKAVAGCRHLGKDGVGLSREVAKCCRGCLVQAALKQVDTVIVVGSHVCGSALVDVVQNAFNARECVDFGVNECVAFGAAIRAGIRVGDVKDVIPLDVIAHSLGIESLGGVMRPVIKANTTIPSRVSQVFSTAADNQPAVSISVYQGECQQVKDNELLGAFNLDGIPPAARGVPQIEVAFDIAADRLLNVTARDLGTGKTMTVTVSGGVEFGKSEIDSMKQIIKALWLQR